MMVGGQSRWMPLLTVKVAIIYLQEGVLDLVRMYVGRIPETHQHANKYEI